MVIACWLVIPMNAYSVSFGDLDKAINKAKEKISDSKKDAVTEKLGATSRSVGKEHSNDRFEVSSAYQSFEKLDLIGKKVTLSNGMIIEFHPTTAKEREKFGYRIKEGRGDKLIKYNDYIALVIVYLNGVSRYKEGTKGDVKYFYQYITSWDFKHPHDIKKWMRQSYDLFEMKFMRYLITPSDERYLWIKALTPDPYFYYSDYYDEFEETFNQDELAVDLNYKTYDRYNAVSEFKVISATPTSRETSKIFSDAEFQRKLKQTRAELAKGS